MTNHLSTQGAEAVREDLPEELRHGKGRSQTLAGGGGGAGRGQLWQDFAALYPKREGRPRGQTQPLLSVSALLSSLPIWRLQRGGTTRSSQPWYAGRGLRGRGLRCGAGRGSRTAAGAKQAAAVAAREKDPVIREEAGTWGWAEAWVAGIRRLRPRRAIPSGHVVGGPGRC